MKSKTDFSPSKILTCPKCKKEIPWDNVFESISIAGRMPQINAECPYCAKTLGSIAYRDSILIKEILYAFANWELQKLAKLRDMVIKEQ